MRRRALLMQHTGPKVNLWNWQTLGGVRSAPGFNISSLAYSEDYSVFSITNSSGASSARVQSSRGYELQLSLLQLVSGKRYRMIISGAANRRDNDIRIYSTDSTLKKYYTFNGDYQIDFAYEEGDTMLYTFYSEDYSIGSIFTLEIKLYEI